VTAITFIQSRIAPVAVLVVATIAAVFAPATAHAQPELIEVAPVEGASLSELPEFFHLCFSEAVKIEPTKEWGFNLRPPDGSGVGLRTVFGTDATCVDVYPGVLAEPPPGIWSLSWLVHAQSDGSEGSGELRYQIGDLQPGDTPLATRKISTAGGDGDAVPTASVVLIGVGVVIVLCAAIGFGLRVRRRKPPA
jgi:methionine-rich copper-binding protein CopC